MKNGPLLMAGAPAAALKMVRFTRCSGLAPAASMRALCFSIITRVCSSRLP
ncbi:MAG: hypothetical protein IH860_03270 [Chloroflexi bacterium]|nr:hypothetical protein [Chloroflexota bacterium]